MLERTLLVLCIVGIAKGVGNQAINNEAQPALHKDKVKARALSKIVAAAKQPRDRALWGLFNPYLMSSAYSHLMLGSMGYGMSPYGYSPYSMYGMGMLPYMSMMNPYYSMMSMSMMPWMMGPMGMQGMMGPMGMQGMMGGYYLPWMMRMLGWDGNHNNNNNKNGKNGGERLLYSQGNHVPLWQQNQFVQPQQLNQNLGGFIPLFEQPLTQQPAN